MLSRLGDTGSTPVLTMAPYDGRNPRTPQYAAGSRIPPMVSIPESHHIDVSRLHKIVHKMHKR